MHLPISRARAFTAPARTCQSSLTLRTLSAVTTALVIAGCGGSGNKDEPSPSAHPSGTTTHCTLLNASPREGVTSGFTNPQVILQYKAGKPQGCGKASLTDAGGKAVASQVVAQSEWTHPQGGVVGAVTLEPGAALQAGQSYRAWLENQAVVTFKIAASPRSRGMMIKAEDQPLLLDGLPRSARIDATDINGLLKVMANKLANGHSFEARIIDSLLEANFPALAHPQARYTARIKKLSYASTGADGTPVTLSGLLVYPENADGSVVDYTLTPLALGQHGSTASEAPSAASGDMVVLGLLAAGKGHVFFAPDLIGLGDTATLPQAYLVTKDTAAASTDMLLAVRDFFTREYAGVALNRDLRIVGGSQGGYSTLAALPQLSRLANVKSVLAENGPYNPYQTLASTIQASGGASRDAYARHEDLSFVPSHLRDVLGALRDYQGLRFDPAEVFAADGSLLPSFIRGFGEFRFPSMVDHVGLNSLTNTDTTYQAPQAKVLLFHYSGDSLVPEQNTVDMLAVLKQSRHQLASVDRGNCHEDSVFVRTVLHFSKSKLKTHVICAPYLVEQFAMELTN